MYPLKWGIASMSQASKPQGYKYWCSLDTNRCDSFQQHNKPQGVTGRTGTLSGTNLAQP